MMNRSNSFVNSLKWWPLQGLNQSTSSVNTVTGTANGSGATTNIGNSNPRIATFGSSVAVQKLRESKWFQKEEQRIFCAVVECGFIVEVRSCCSNNTNNRSRNASICRPKSSNGSYDDDLDNDDDEDDDDDDVGQDENATPVTSWFGIVLCKTAKDNKPKPETIEIFSVKIRENGTFKMIRLSLDDIWNHNWEIRINNFADKEKMPHNEKDIRQQVSFARKAKQSLWNNNKHFAYWCRYGSRQQDVRKRQMSECVKWGSVGMNAGMLLVMNKQKSYSTSKT